MSLVKRVTTDPAAELKAARAAMTISERPQLGVADP
jgi:hypothetical protein